jgi:hypothetical protein
VGEDELRDPAAVGARWIEPSEAGPRRGLGVPRPGQAPGGYGLPARLLAIAVLVVLVAILAGLLLLGVRPF